MAGTWEEHLRVAQLHLVPFLAQFALHLITENLDVSRLQFKRIRHDTQTLEGLYADASERWQDENYQAVRRATQVALFADIHFLLIALQQLDLLFKWLEMQLPDEPELEAVRTKHNEMLKDANDFRNDLEHIDTRIRNGVSDLGNLTNGEFTFGGKTFGIGSRLEQQVEEFFEDLLVACETISQRQRD